MKKFLAASIIYLHFATIVFAAATFIGTDGQTSIFKESRPSGRTILWGDTPTYNAQDNKYTFQGYMAQPVNAPDPAAAATGDMTLHPGFIVNPKQIVAEVPGTNLVKLADGTYTNLYPDIVPSITLEDVYNDLSTPAPPTNGACFQIRTPYEYSAKTPAIHINAFDGPPYSVVHTVSQPYVNNISAGDAIRLPDNKTAFVSSVNYTSGQITGELVTEGTYCGQSDSLYDGSPTPPGPAELAGGLEPFLDDAPGNGLAEDFDKACVEGDCNFPAPGVSNDDVTEWGIDNLPENIDDAPENLTTPTVAAPGPPEDEPAFPLSSEFDFVGPIQTEMDSLTSKFTSHEPFATLNAVTDALGIFDLQPVAPTFTVNFPVVGEKTIDLSICDDAARVIRGMIGLLFTVASAQFVLRVWVL